MAELRGGRNVDSLEVLVVAEVQGAANDHTRSAPIRAAVREVLAHHAARRGNHAAATDLYADLAAAPASDSVDAARMLYNMVVVRKFGARNEQGAQSAYLALRSAYPASREVPMAKVLLRIPLSDSEVNTLRKAGGSGAESSDERPSSTRTRADIWSVCYPNPCNPSGTIRYSVPENGQVTITAYPILGNRKTVLYHGPVVSGVHSVLVDAAGLPSGVFRYMVEFETENETRVQLHIGSFHVVK
ncbi:MAG: hypothetical protein HY962_17735 [Ignavibacteriae bacterium]|nr:hypothetical protein [Ignavibacteriota bacterium]